MALNRGLINTHTHAHMHAYISMAWNWSPLACMWKERDWENATRFFLYFLQTCFVFILQHLSVISFSVSIAKANVTFLLSHFNWNFDFGMCRTLACICRTYCYCMRAKNNINRRAQSALTHMALHETDLINFLFLWCNSIEFIALPKG